MAALLASACAPVAPPGTPAPMVAPSAPPGFPQDEYARAAVQGRPVQRIDAAQSLVTITVRRGGSLARLGHDHVIASRDVQGFVLPDEGRADLFVPLDALTVDEPALRTAAGLDTQPSAADIAGTRDNMLHKVLDAERFPYAVIHVGSVEHTAGGAALHVVLTLQGRAQAFVVPARVERGRDETIVSGMFEFDQSAFGIVPFSILGGAVKVEDRVRLQFTVRAGRLQR